MTNKTKAILAATCAASALGFGPMIAHAQDGATDASASNGTQDSDDFQKTLSTVTVTSLKRDQNIQDVAAAISAVSGDDLSAKGAVEIEDLVTIVPNLNFNEHLGTTLISIRGVGSIVDTGVTEPTVALYVDGVFLPRATMATLRALDLERVEVLRGPQGTLYGRNASAGAINFISKAPTDTFEAGVTISTGSREALGLEGYISGPIADGVSVRLSGGTEEQDGYEEILNTGQLVNGTDANFIRGAVRFEPTDRLDVDLSVRFEENTAPNSYQRPYTTPIVAPFPGLASTEMDEFLANRPSAQDVETLIAAGTVTWDLSDNVTLKSITSYVDHEITGAFDADGSLVDFFHVSEVAPFIRTSESFGQEFTLSGQTENLDWLVGAFYFEEDFFNFLPVTLGTVGAGANGVPDGSILDQAIATSSESVSIYTDLTYSLTDRFRVNLGARYLDEKQDFTQTFGVRPIVPEIMVPFDASESKFLPKIGIQYDFTDNTNMYAQWSQGYKSGGGNLPGGGAEFLGPVLGPYAPEEIDAYEIGLKTASSDGSVIANVAAFYYDYSDLQATETVPPAATVIRNADAEITGIEGDISWQATDAFKLGASATFTDANFVDFAPINLAGMVVDLDGEPLPQAPEYTFNVNGEYVIDLGGELFSELTLAGNVFTTDETVIRYFGSPDDIRGAYTLANISAGISSSDDMTELNFFVKNVGDERYKQHIINFALGFYGSYNLPRTWGARLTKRF